MNKNFTLLIGGIQGEGVVSTGISLMKALSRRGYYTLSERKFSSRIKGGNTHVAITIAKKEEVNSVESCYDMIMAMDQDSIHLNMHQLKPKGILLYDEDIKIDEEWTDGLRSIALPLSAIAKKHGKLFMKNTSVIGCLGKVTGFTYEVLQEMVTEAYGNKGEEVLDQNIAVLKTAFNHASTTISRASFFDSEPAQAKKKMMMIGNEAIAIGAVVAGCRFMAGYPITPASDVMENLALIFPLVGGKTVQTEDEVAAIAMTIGASHAGVRSMTATSGPGMTLMGEGLGLAGMTETPIVVVDAQRAGPSTGMPTKMEQSDLSFLYHAGHGEYAAIILSPSTLQECYEMTVDAFNLADRYQCPVIIMTDLNLSLSAKTIDEISFSEPVIDRGQLASTEILESSYDGGFTRYQLTENGISARAIPGTKGGQHQVTGLEHNELGRPSDHPENRKAMMDKRMKKTDPLKEREGIILEGKASGSTLFLTFGSLYGTLKEAWMRTGKNVDLARIGRIKPLPVKQLETLMDQYEKIIVVECNYHGQLANIINQETGQPQKVKSITRYDGKGFSIEEMMEIMDRWCQEWK